MKETYYFPHDYNATQDPKMMALLASCGLAGVGMYWILAEILHQQPEGKILHTNFEDFVDFYGRIDAENEQVLNKIKQVLITTGLYVQQDDFVFSERVLKNKKERERLSELRSYAGKISAKNRQNPTSVQHLSNTCQQGKERKVKESIYSLALGITFWNSMSLWPTNQPTPANTTVLKKLLPTCRKETELLNKAWNKVSPTQEEWETAVKAYILEIANRNPSNDYANHRFSLYDFVKQSNGYAKFLNR